MILCKQMVLNFSVKYSQINDIIGEEEWVDGEMNTNSASIVCWKISKRIIQPLEQDIGKCSRRTLMNLNQSSNWF